MKQNSKVNQMSHLSQKTISDNSCKSIIIDTLFALSTPVSSETLSDQIASVFHVIMSKERLSSTIQSLIKDGTLELSQNGYITISHVKRADLLLARYSERDLQKEATDIWLQDITVHDELSDDLKEQLSNTLPIFLRSLFVKHGVSSYELLFESSENDAFDVSLIAEEVSKQFSEPLHKDIAKWLPTIFHSIDKEKVLEYLKHNVNKAIGYICEVISPDNLEEIKSCLNRLTLYLDTNVLYRILNLQGITRYEAIKETLDFCRENGVSLRISALTKKELSSRLEYDSRVLLKFPTATNLCKYGYKYRSSDNYVSTYWNQTSTTRISVNDFISYYQNFDVLLESNHIEIESLEVDEQPLIERAKVIYEKMSLRDRSYEKSENSLWHDAYNFAYVQKMQKQNPKTAIDAEFLFLTTDQALTSLQREDYDLKDLPIVVIAPSQLLQLFSFTKPDSGYEETFIKYFASSSLGVTYEYDNNDIQEIMSRIAHYKGLPPEIAEKILQRLLINSRYLEESTDEEKEEIVYNNVAEELQKEIDNAQAQVSTLEEKNTKLENDRVSLVQSLEENQKQFKLELERMRAVQDSYSEQKNTEAAARKEAEGKLQRAIRYSEKQETLYISEKMGKEINRLKWLFWVGMMLVLGGIAISLYLWIQHKNPTYLGLLTLPAMLFTPVISAGAKAYSNSKKQEMRAALKQEYEQKLTNGESF